MTAYRASIDGAIVGFVMVDSLDLAVGMHPTARAGLQAALINCGVLPAGAHWTNWYTVGMPSGFFIGRTSDGLVLALLERIQERIQE